MRSLRGTKEMYATASVCGWARPAPRCCVQQRTEREREMWERWITVLFFFAAKFLVVHLTMTGQQLAVVCRIASEKWQWNYMGKMKLFRVPISNFVGNLIGRFHCMKWEWCAVHILQTHRMCRFQAQPYRHFEAMHEDIIVELNGRILCGIECILGSTDSRDPLLWGWLMVTLLSGPQGGPLLAVQRARFARGHRTEPYVSRYNSQSHSVKYPEA